MRGKITKTDERKLVELGGLAAGDWFQLIGYVGVVLDWSANPHGNCSDIKCVLFAGATEIERVSVTWLRDGTHVSPIVAEIRYKEEL